MCENEKMRQLTKEEREIRKKIYEDMSVPTGLDFSDYLTYETWVDESGKDFYEDLIDKMKKFDYKIINEDCRTLKHISTELFELVNLRKNLENKNLQELNRLLDIQIKLTTSESEPEQYKYYLIGVINGITLLLKNSINRENNIKKLV